MVIKTGHGLQSEPSIGRKRFLASDITRIGIDFSMIDPWVSLLPLETPVRRSQLPRFGQVWLRIGMVFAGLAALGASRVGGWPDRSARASRSSASNAPLVMASWARERPTSIRTRSPARRRCPHSPPTSPRTCLRMTRDPAPKPTPRRSPRTSTRPSTRKEARARNRPPRIEISRLTVRQYRNAVADLIGSFRTPAKTDLDRVARIGEGEPPGEPLRLPARTEPRPPGITQIDLEARAACRVFQVEKVSRRRSRYRPARPGSEVRLRRVEPRPGK